MDRWQHRVDRNKIRVPGITTATNVDVVVDMFVQVLLISASSLRVYYCQQLTLSVRLSCSLKSILLFCFSMESSHFWVVSSPCGTVQIVDLRFLI